MKFKVLTWIRDEILLLLGSISEISLRVLLFFIPLGLYMMLLQFRGKVSKVSNLSIYTNDSSVWQHVFPGFILVAIDPNMFKKLANNANLSIQKWVKDNKYTLLALFSLLILGLLFILVRKVG